MPGWSFWDAADGMKESFTSSVAIHAGSVWIKHGSVTGMNVLDGYTVTELPDPGDIGKIQTSPDGTLWIWTGQHLARYCNSRWEAFPVESVTGAGVLRGAPDQNWIFTSNRPPYPQARIWVGGIDAKHALIMLPDRILEFDAGGKTARVVLEASETSLGHFSSMQWKTAGSFWITGQKGLGRLSTTDWKWHESVSPPAGYTDFDEPNEGEDGEVFLTAADSSLRAVVLRVADAAWEIVYRGDSRALRGWRGGTGAVHASALAHSAGNGQYR